jgi:hypothetical protein
MFKPLLHDFMFKHFRCPGMAGMEFPRSWTSRFQLFREGGTAGTAEPDMEFGAERSLGVAKMAIEIVYLC